MLSESYEISPNERALFEHFDIVRQIYENVPTLVVYRMMIEIAFLDEEGKYSDTAKNILRKVYRAINASRPYRLTAEFEALFL